jgi:hypothetical protein
MRLRGTPRLGRALGEFLLIVAGVSVALGAESLFGLRQERVREADHLAQIRSDVEENERRLVEAIALEESRRGSAQIAFEAANARQVISADSAQAWLIERRGLYAADPRLLTGSLSALIGTGDLRLIQDRGVRAALVAYVPQVVSDRTEFDRWTQHQVLFLTSLHRVGVSEGSPGDLSQHPAVSALSAAPLNPEVLIALEGVLWTARNRLTYLNRMLDATRQLLNGLPAPE